MNKAVLLLPVLLFGCAQVEPCTAPEMIIQPLYHPTLEKAPDNPGVNIKVITTETIEAEKAYVGFEYNDWLKFAKWMHEFKSYNKSLLIAIDSYISQDKTLYTEMNPSIIESNPSEDN